MSSRRERTRQLNQERLLAAARAVFARQELAAVTIRDIVRESGLSRGTFYNYLGTREAAFEAVAADLVADVAAAARRARAEAPDAQAFVVDPFRAMVAVLARDAETLALVTLNGRALREVVGGLGSTQGLEADLRADLDAAVTGGLLPAHRTDWMAAAMLGAALEVVTRLDGSEQGVEQAGAFLGELFFGALRGLSPD